MLDIQQSLNFKIEEEIYWPLSFCGDYFRSEINIEENKRIIDFAMQRLNFLYSNIFEYGFSPYISLIEKRSITYSDLTDDDFDFIKEITKKTNNVYILAKCYDVLYLKYNDIEYCKKAAECFYKITEFYCLRKRFFQGSPFFKRTLFLLKKTGDFGAIDYCKNRFIMSLDYKERHGLAILASSYYDFVKDCKYSKKDKKLIDYLVEADIEASDNGLKTINLIIDYYSSVKDENSINKWINKYADLCEEICEKESPFGYTYINNAIDMLEKREDENEDRINNLMFRREEEQKKLSDSLIPISIKYDNKTIETIDKSIKFFEEKIISTKDSLEKLVFFIEFFVPIDIEKIRKKIPKNNDYFSYCNQIVIGEDKTIIAEISPNDVSKKIKIECASFFCDLHNIYAHIAMMFIKNLMIDNEIEALISKILSNNLFVPEEYIKPLKDNIIMGLKGDIKQAVYNVISQFEAGIVYFLKAKKIYPSIRKNGHESKADLNHFLTIKKFRNEIKEILGENLTTELEFLLVEGLYGNLRNKSYHKGLRDEATNSIEIVSFFRILSAYFYGYNGDYKL